MLQTHESDKIIKFANWYVSKELSFSSEDIQEQLSKKSRNHPEIKDMIHTILLAWWGSGKATNYAVRFCSPPYCDGSKLFFFPIESSQYFKTNDKTR
jgi:hypothetical protein